MKDLQTPQKELSRSSKLKDSSLSKKPRTLARKRLSGVFTSVFGDISDDFSQFSVSDSPEVSKVQSTQISVSNSDLVTPTSTLTSDAVSAERYLSRQVENAYVVENLLKLVRSRKVLDEIIKVAVAEHLATIPPASLLDVEVDRAINVKGCVVLFCFGIWCLVASVAFFGIGSSGPRIGPLPT